MDELLTPEEKDLIRHYAANNGRNPSLNEALRAEAEIIYWKHIAEHCKRDRNKRPEIEFMSECLSPCPDYKYKSDLRRRICLQAGERTKAQRL
jgi:hypothetical protein